MKEKILEREELFRMICERIIRHINSINLNQSITLERAFEFDEGICLYVKDLIGPNDSGLWDKSYESILHTLIKVIPEASFLKKEMSLEEIDLNLAIRGY